MSFTLTVEVNPDSCQNSCIYLRFICCYPNCDNMVANNYCSFFRLIDCFLVESPVTSLAMSPVADFLVTTHVDDLGVYLW